MIEEVPKLFGEPISPYFTMLAIGFAMATWLGVRWAKQVGLDKEVVIDLGLYSLIAGVAGGRILHVLADGYFWDYVHLCTDPAQVVWRISEGECTQAEGIWNAAEKICRPGARDCFAWAAFWRGGLTYYGGLIGASAFGLWFLKREKFPVRKGIDMAGMAIPLGLFFGRLGCFLGGCCFGSVHEGFPSVRFPAWSPASEQQFRDGLLPNRALESLAVHPTQLYESLGCLAISAGLLFWLHPRKRFDGQVFLAFLASYSVLRFCVEYLRADDRGGILGLSTSQWLSAIALVIVLVVYRYLEPRNTASPGTAME